MSFSLPLLIPLACAFLYVVAALMLKRASGLGVGVWRIGFLSNWAMLIFFVPWWLVQSGGSGHPWTDYWQPAVNALLFLAAQMFLFFALQGGDVSVTTPVMGTKVIMVALLSHLLRAGEVPWQWWTGAGLSTAAVALLHLGEPRARRSALGADSAIGRDERANVQPLRRGVAEMGGRMEQRSLPTTDVCIQCALLTGVRAIFPCAAIRA